MYDRLLDVNSNEEIKTVKHSYVYTVFIATCFGFNGKPL